MLGYPGILDITCKASYVKNGWPVPRSRAIIIPCSCPLILTRVPSSPRTLTLRFLSGGEAARCSETVRTSLKAVELPIPAPNFSKSH